MIKTKNRPLAQPALSFGDGETILLIESKESLRKLGKNVLEKLNYQVVTAPSQQEFNRRSDIQQDQIDLLILDGSAPIRESREIVRQVRTYRPDAKTLFSSVYDTQLETECGKKIAREKIVNKPFRIDDFSRTIYQMLH